MSHARGLPDATLDLLQLIEIGSDMQISFRLILAAALGAASMGSAAAADLHVKAPVAKAPAAVYDWTGFYVGGHLGWAWTDKNWRTPAGADLTSYTADGFIGGVQGGYNWQTGAWVVGVEAQASWGDVVTGRNWTDPEPVPVVPIKRTGTTVANLGTVALRLGHAVDRSLFYVKGGGAWVYETYRLFDATTPGTPLLASATGTRWGWMTGIGYEYAFLGNWSAKIELDYLDFGRERITVAGPTTVRAFDVTQDVVLVKAGINYRFGGPAVTAKY